MSRRHTGVGSTNLLFLLTGIGSSVHPSCFSLRSCAVAFGEAIVYLCRCFTVTTGGWNRDHSELDFSSGRVF
ncbi:MAG: hypothetical protein JSU63_12250 [Phycisphaerales bacterium]|nr:MAG: hypothetical protein JSU63_12250 [Phycisphaerales bacterium]